MTPPARPSLEQLAAGELDGLDIRILDRVAGMYDTVDPVPRDLVGRIQFGLTLDALHAEIAELQRSTDLAGVRADDTAEAQTITFASRSLTIMVTVTPLSAEQARIDGWIAPGSALEVQVRTRSGVESTEADADGRFVFEDVPRGVVQFVVRASDEPHAGPVITPSVAI